MSDVALTLPIQDQLLSVLGSLDQAAGSLAFNSTLNRDIPGTGRSLNDLLDSADGSVDRDWGDFIQFEQVAAAKSSFGTSSAAGGLGILGATLDADSDLTPDYDDSTTIEGEHMLRESDIAGLNTDIPLINQSPNDLLGFTDGLLAASEKLLAGVDIDAIKGLRL